MVLVLSVVEGTAFADRIAATGTRQPVVDELRLVNVGDAETDLGRDGLDELPHRVVRELHDRTATPAELEVHRDLGLRAEEASVDLNGRIVIVLDAVFRVDLTTARFDTDVAPLCVKRVIKNDEFGESDNAESRDQDCRSGFWMFEYPHR